jgi:hypothetical protein
MIGNTKVTVGIDIGSTATKAVILAGGKIVSTFIGPSTVNPSKTARLVFQEVLSSAGLEENQVIVSSAPDTQRQGDLCPEQCFGNLLSCEGRTSFFPNKDHHRHSAAGQQGDRP